MKIPRRQYADLYGPTTGDRIRLADTDLLIEISRDLTVPGEEAKFGGNSDGPAFVPHKPDESAMLRRGGLQVPSVLLPQRLQPYEAPGQDNRERLLHRPSATAASTQPGISRRSVASGNVPWASTSS